MTLSEFLKEHGSLTAFAAQLGRPVSTVHSWKEGHRLPPLRDALLIERVTKGKVTVADFVPAEVAS